MEKSRPRRQKFSHRRQDYDDNLTSKPNNHHQDDAVEGHRQPETSSNSNFKPANRRKPKWEPRNRVGKPVFVPKSDVCESEFGERESEVREGHGGVEVEEVGGGECADDVFSRLGKLKVRVEEVRLPEEQMRINDQAQEDELLAMESIYGDNVYVLEKRRGLRSFQIHIHIELPSEFAVSTKLKTATHSDPKVDDSDEFSYTFRVQYLSPIVLSCLLPRSYPSHCPPSFTISVQWLHESRISKLCSMLDSLWNEQPGQEILYQWVEWLHGSSLSYLGFGEELVLGPFGVKNDSDRRALSGSVSPDVDIPSMKSYDEERQHENFLSSFHECCICFSEYAEFPTGYLQ